MIPAHAWAAHQLRLVCLSLAACGPLACSGSHQPQDASVDASTDAPADAADAQLDASDAAVDSGPDGGADSGRDGCSTPDFVLIEPGTFTMGSPETELGRDNTETQHQVTLTRGFYLQTTEVTQAEWTTRMGNNPSNNQSSDCLPVESLAWWEALAYANASSAADGLPECYTLEGCTDVSPGDHLLCEAVTVNAPGGDPYACTGYRLPTEAEWEYAYRAGTTMAFYNGDITDTGSCHQPNLEAIGWYACNAHLAAHLVAQKQPNAGGLYDMAGNVYEWVWDMFGDYTNRSVTDPTGAETGSAAVMRGGSWSYNSPDARAASRNFVTGHGGVFLDYVGFRLARSAP